MKKPYLGPKEVVYRNRYQTITRRKADFGNFQKEYFIVETGGRVGVVVENSQGILLTRQYRHLIDRLSWEVPGGRAEEDEDLKDAARRECFEETGIDCRTLNPLIQYHPGLDTYYNPTHVFWAKDFEIHEAHHPPQGEVFECHWIPLDQCLAMITSGEINDSLSIISIYSYHINSKTLP